MHVLYQAPCIIHINTSLDFQLCIVFNKTGKNIESFTVCKYYDQYPITNIKQNKIFLSIRSSNNVIQ